MHIRGILSEMKSRRWAIGAAIVLLLVLRFWRLDADFPSALGPQGGAIRTDEGWYCNGAVSSIMMGHWYRPGDFNVAVNCPAWPALQYVVFRIFGMSLRTARATPIVMFAMIAGICFVWVRRECGTLAAVAALLLLVTQHHLFAYSRLALPETPLVCLTVAAVALASGASRRQRWAALASGVLLALAVMTKVSAIGALPALALAAFAGNRAPRQRLGNAALALGAFAALVGLHMVVARWKFAGDYAFYNRLFFASRARFVPGSLVENYYLTLEKAVRLAPWGWALATAGAAALWFGKPAGAGGSPPNAIGRRRLVLLLVVWAAGYTAVLDVTSQQPMSYFVPYFVVQCLLAGAGAAALAERLPERWRTWATAALVAPFVIGGLLGCGRDLASARYTLRDAVRNINERAWAEGPADRDPCVMGNMADTVALATHIPSANAIGPGLDVARRLKRHEPALYVAQEPQEAGLTELRALRALELVAAYDVMNCDGRQPPVTLFRILPGEPMRNPPSAE